MQTFSFDENEFADQPDDTAGEVLRDMEESLSPESNEDPELADVDLRLEVADYYRAILNHDFFSTESKAGEMVDREIRSFIRERLEVLLGLRDPRQPQVVMPFEEDEIAALKALAAKVLQKPGLMKTEERPAVRKMPTPVPTAKPQARRPKPQARKVPAPRAAPSSKPRAVAKPRTDAPSAPKPTPAPNPEADSQTFVSTDGKQVTLIEGEVLFEEGRRYIVAKNEMGTLYRRDITGQVVAPGRIPPQTPQQMSLMSERLAMESIGRLDETTGLAIVASLQQK